MKQIIKSETSDSDAVDRSPDSFGKLVDACGLLNVLFDEHSRPSLRWLRQMQAQRKIPYVKIGHLVRFDVDQVRAALEENCTVHSRNRLRSK